MQKITVHMQLLTVKFDNFAYQILLQNMQKCLGDTTYCALLNDDT